MCRCLSCNTILTNLELDIKYDWNESVQLCTECMENSEVFDTEGHEGDEECELFC